MRTLLTETENNRTSLCVVLAGYREAMEGLMRADPGLVRRFPTSLHLDDYSPAELAAIAKQTAHVRFGLRFAEGVQAALTAHLAAAHGHEIHAHNASLAVSLVEAAINRLALRLMGGAAAGEAASMPASPAQPAVAGGAPCEAAVGSSGAVRPLMADERCTLVASDFLIPPSLCVDPMVAKADLTATARAHTYSHTDPIVAKTPATVETAGDSPPCVLE